MENEIFLEGGGLNNTGGSSRTRGPTVMLATPGSFISVIPAWGGYSIGQPTELGYYAPSIGFDQTHCCGYQQCAGFYGERRVEHYSLD